MPVNRKIESDIEYNEEKPEKNVFYSYHPAF
jgi:hypothetical protein